MIILNHNFAVRYPCFLDLSISLDYTCLKCKLRPPLGQIIWNKDWEQVTLRISRFFPFRFLRELKMWPFTRLLTNFTSMGRGTCGCDWPSCVASRLLDSAETGFTSSGSVPAASAETSRETGWLASSARSIWPGGSDGFPTRWVTSRSSIEIGGFSCIMVLTTCNTLVSVSPRVFSGTPENIWKTQMPCIFVFYITLSMWVHWFV